MHKSAALNSNSKCKYIRIYAYIYTYANTFIYMRMRNSVQSLGFNKYFLTYLEVQVRSRALDRGLPPIHHQVRPGAIAALVAGEEEGGVGDLAGIAHAAQHDVPRLHVRKCIGV